MVEKAWYKTGICKKSGIWLVYNCPGIQMVGESHKITHMSKIKNSFIQTVTYENLVYMKYTKKCHIKSYNNFCIILVLLLQCKQQHEKFNECRPMQFSFSVG